MLKLYKPNNEPFESIEQAEGYIRDNVWDIFEVDEWVQGELYEKGLITIQVQDKYYNVDVYVEVLGERQYEGLKRYNIDDVHKVIFKETTQGSIEVSIDKHYELKRRYLQAELDNLNVDKQKTWISYDFPNKQPNQELEGHKQELIDELLQHRWENVDIEWLLQDYRENQKEILSDLSLNELKELVKAEIA